MTVDDNGQDSQSSVSVDDVDKIIHILEELSLAIKKIKTEDLEKLLSEYETK